MSDHNSNNTPRSKALALLAAFDTLDTAASISLRAPSCEWHMLPSSLNFPPLTNEQHAQHMSAMPRILSAFPVTPLDVVESVSLNGQPIVTIHATGTPILREEVRQLLVKDEEGRGLLDTAVELGDGKGGLVNEYLFVVTFEAGKGAKARIEKVVEFLDVRRTLALLGVLGRARVLAGDQ